MTHEEKEFDRWLDVLSDNPYNDSDKALFKQFFLSALASAEKKGREEAGCDLCGKEGASVCCECHCKQIVESRKEGWNEAIEAARKVIKELGVTSPVVSDFQTSVMLAERLYEIKQEIAESINKLKRRE